MSFKEEMDKRTVVPPYSGILIRRIKKRKKKKTTDTQTTWMNLKIITFSEKRPRLKRYDSTCIEQWLPEAEGECDYKGTSFVKMGQFCVLTVGWLHRSRHGIKFHKTMHTYT